MKKENKIVMICYITASICFYVSAIICFIRETNNNSMGVVNLCLGSTFLCLFSVYMNKDKDKNENDNK